MFKNKEEIIHIAAFPATSGMKNPGDPEIYIPKTAILNWLRACALAETTTEVPRNTVKAIIDSIENWKISEEPF